MVWLNAKGNLWYDISMKTIPSDHQSRMTRALLSLDGLSVGDGFGECFFASATVIERRLAERDAGDYEESLWATVSGLGDRDTTCAIVGGIVAAGTGREGIPTDWLNARAPVVV